MLQVAAAAAGKVRIAEVEHVNAFWVGLLLELMKVGLIQQQDGHTPEDAPALQLTAAGTQELAGLARRSSSGGNAQQSGVTDAGATSLRTTRLRCSRALVQSLLQPCGAPSGSPAQLTAQVPL